MSSRRAASAVCRRFAKSTQELVLSSPQLKSKSIKQNDQRKKGKEVQAQGKAGKILLHDLKVCANTRDLARGKEIHAQATEGGKDSCIYVATGLVSMYAKCGSLAEARRVFDGIKQPDVVLWNALILGYAENGEGLTALDLFARMTSQGCSPDSFTFVAAIKACTALAVQKDGSRRGECLQQGKQIHSEVHCTSDIYVQNSLIAMYSKCGSMDDARQVFESIKHPDVISWTGLISGYAENGEGLTALDQFSRMKSQGIAPNRVTYLAALKACSCLAVEQDGLRRVECLRRGKEIHSSMSRPLDTHLRNALIDMYAKCGSMVDAREVFDSLTNPDVVSWTALISGYADNGESVTALDLFAKMKSKGCAPNAFTFAAAIKACTLLALEQDGSQRAKCLQRGKQLHSEINCGSNVYVRNALIDMYAKCGSMTDARKVFDGVKNPDVVSWTSLILGYAESGDAVTALDLFDRMRCQGCKPNSFTFVAALKACTSLALKPDQSGKSVCLERGRRIHSEIGCVSDTYVQNTLVDMYSKCGCMVEARRVFDSMKSPTVVSWTALMLGYADNGEGSAALDLFAGMRSRGCAPNYLTYVAALRACSSLGALEAGSRIHAEINAGTIGCNDILVASLVDFYAKCGCMVEAQKVFDSHPGTRNLRIWTTLLAGYSRFGDSESVFRLFQEMKDAGFQPDGVTFLCILTCCSHAGLTGKASEYFEAMSARYGITPTVEHYTCMIDILGRSNRLDDAMVLLRSMPYSPNAVTWMALLGACWKWKNVDIGEQAFKSLMSLDDANPTAYVLMANIYGSQGMREEQDKLLVTRPKAKGLRASEQSCWTNRAGEVHKFVIGESKHQHPQTHEIREKLRAMSAMMRDVGDLLSIGHNAAGADSLCGHSEKLALAYAMINTEPGETLRIVKNLRVCEDCHSFIALVSKLESRDIVCRDASRFHVFKGGKCSCGDVW